MRTARRLVKGPDTAKTSKKQFAREAPSPCCHFNNKIFKKFKIFKIFPVLAPFFLCKKINLLNSLCFPCLEKLTAKFPVFPVPWPPCCHGTACNFNSVSVIILSKFQILLNYSVPVSRSMFHIQG